VELFDDLRSMLADTLRARVLVLFGRVIDRVDVEIEEDIARGDLVTNVAINVAPAISPATVGSSGELAAAAREVAERLIHGMLLPQLVASASIENDGTIEFHLDRGSVIVELLDRDDLDSLLLQRIPDDLWRAARACAGGTITSPELLQFVAASSKRR
jgi:hypothetical protein